MLDLYHEAFDVTENNFFPFGIIFALNQHVLELINDLVLKVMNSFLITLYFDELVFQYYSKNILIKIILKKSNNL